MRARYTLVAAVTLALAAAIAPQAADPTYAKVGEIHIGGAGGFDYLTVDPAAKRLYVTHGTEVVVIDTSNDTVVGRITDTPRVHGVAIAPGRGFTSNGGEDKVSIFDLKTLQTLSKVETRGANPDAITYDPKTKAIYVFNKTGKSAAAIDAAGGTVNAVIPLSGLPETGQADPALDRVFVNIQDTSSVDAIDTTTNKVVATWPLAPATSPTGMAIDTSTHRLFVGGGPVMVMMDARTGKVVANAPICTGTDATFFDPGTKMVFAACGDGTITAMKVDGDKLTVVQTIPTARGARTMTVDPVTHKIYTATQNFQAPDSNAASTPPPAAPPAGRGRGPAPVPDSFHVIVFGMK